MGYWNKKLVFILAVDEESSQLMLDFTSALYLGLQHPSRALKSWEQFTMGKPNALQTPPDATKVAGILLGY